MILIWDADFQKQNHWGNFASMKRQKFHIEAFNNLNTHSVNIKIIDRIGDYGNDAQSISQVVDNALSKGVTHAEIFISSGGGSTIEAQDIVLQLKRFTTVNITVGALAASAATYILTQFESSAYPESQFMVHRPKFTAYGTAEEVKAQLKLLENTEDTYRKAYATAFGKTEDEINELWKNDFWMTAEEAKNLGLIQNIITANIKWDTNAIESLSACGAPHIPKPNNQNFNNMDKNKIIAALGLPADATDEQIYGTIASVKQKAGASDTLKTQLKEVQKQKVEALVASAINAKKITADQKQTYEDLATANYEATEAALKSMPVLEALSGTIQTPNALSGEASADRNSWTYEDYVENDPQAFEKLMETDKSKAMAIFNKRRQ
ncbi:ATP-dependent Clp protease proteolytic subunit [Riemerella anatipestifer]|nr:ATP-dependent Clp protease proteolytic subunit [Riemerella anatipestifer]MDY3356845.1 ATP-dependent Clp protease proteolytic subunit [Riemerella anatipestifer]